VHRTIVVIPIKQTVTGYTRFVVRGGSLTSTRSDNICQMHKYLNMYIVPFCMDTCQHLFGRN